MLRTAFGHDHAAATLFAALVVAALVPTLGVLRFMSVATRDEAAAVQAHFEGFYANHLASPVPFFRSTPAHS